MASLLSPHRERLYGCITEVLQALNEDADNAAETEGVLDAAHCVIIDAVRSVMDAAIADFSEARNAKYCDLVLRLPAELVHACFRQCDFEERLAISRVSRAWRRFALADPFMWNRALITDNACNWASADMLKVLLARSDPVPFDFTWKVRFVEFPAEILEIVMQNMHRMQIVHLDRNPEGSLARILQQPSTPLMKRLVCTKWDGAFALPENWAEQVPRLEHLDVGRISMPPNMQPLRCLTSLHVDLAALSPVAGRLNDVFPCLAHLYLGITPETFRSFAERLPTSLSTLQLVPFTESGPVDYSSFLRSYNPARLTRLVIADAVTVSGTLELFTRTTRGTWRMKVLHYFGLFLDGDADDVSYEAFCDRGKVSFKNIPRPTACLARLSMLSLGTALLLELHALQPWDRALPVLRNVEIVVESFEETAQFLDAARESTSPFRTPLLDSLALRMRYSIDIELSDDAKRECSLWLANDFPGALPALFTLPNGELSTLEITLSDPEELQQYDLTSLRSLARTLRLNDSF